MFTHIAHPLWKVSIGLLIVILALTAQPTPQAQAAFAAPSYPGPDNIGVANQIGEGLTPTSLTVLPLSDTYGNDVSLSATLSPAVEGLTIDFTLNGAAACSAATNPSGVATCTALLKINVATYPGGVAASFAGDATYSASNGSADLTVTQRPITVTPMNDTKTYDGIVAASNFNVRPTITEGTLAPGDTATWEQLFDSRDVGTNKVIRPYGHVEDGNNGDNYAVNDVSISTGTILARHITVTAVTDSKPYDGTTASSAVPTIPLNDIVIGDSADCTQTFDNQYPGTGKVLTPVCTIHDDFGGANYDPAYVQVSTGEITKRPITVTAATDSKPYDGNTSSDGVPSITDGSFLDGDSGTWTQAFGDKNAGEAKTITPTGTVTGHPEYYDLIFVPINTGVITPLPITVTAVSATKTYDGTTSASGTPQLTSGTLIGSETATWTQAFETKLAGGGKKIIPAGSVSDGNGGHNYDVTFINDTTGVINAKPITVTAVAATKTYDGTTSAPGTPTTPAGAIVSGDSATWTQTYDNRNAGSGKTLTPSGTISDGNGGNNYFITPVTVATGTINKLTVTVTAAASTKVYDGNLTSAGSPTIVPALATGDSANFTQSYSDRNAGNNKTLIPAGSINDSNSGKNYTVSMVNSTNGEITARPISVTAGVDSKVYDGTTTSTGTPTVTSGMLVAGEIGTWTQAYVTKDAGEFKAIHPGGSVSDGNGGNNYAVTFIDNNNGLIITRPITVSAVTDSRVYNGATSSNKTPQITLGTLASGETATWMQAFETKHADTDKTIIPGGSVNDGNGGHNYAVTFVNNTTGMITAKPITVTAVATTKTYDGTTSSSGTPTTPAGAIESGDPVTWTQTYNNRNAGSGKTLTPAGTISDGNGGDNYIVTPVSVATGVINKLTVTVTAVAATKVYDGNLDSAGVPTIVPALASGDSANFTQTYDTRHVGSSKTLTVAGSINDNNSGNNYTVSMVNSTDGEITARPITVTAATDSREYDGTPNSSNTPSITLGSLVSGETATWTQAFETKHAGTGKIIIPDGAVDDGNGGDNYAVSFVNNTTGVITAKPITVSALSDTKTYDGTNASTKTPTISLGALASGDSATWTQTFDNKNAGSSKTITPAGTITDGNAGKNYNVTLAEVTTGMINKLNLTVTADPISKVYNTADPALTYTVDPQLISGDLFTGSLTRASGEDVGDYEIQQGTLSAGTNYEIVTYTPANLSITPADQIITVNTHAPALAMNGVVFTVAATSSSGLDVTYSASGGCSNVGAEFTMNASSTSCQVKYDQPGSLNYSAAMQVVETVSLGIGPQVTLDPVNAIVYPGGTATFTVETSGGPTPTIQWQVSTDGGATFVDLTDETGSSLVIVNPPLASNHYQYRAVVTNELGEDTSSAARLILMYYTTRMPLIKK